MIRGLYIATSGMLSNQRMQDVVSNNIANANTVGFKTDTGVFRSFPEELLTRINDSQGGVGADRKTIGQLPSGTTLEEVLPRFVQGGLADSDNPHARAIIDGPPTAEEPFRRSYFPVSVGNQTMYTRDGDFHVQAVTNFLVTTGGEAVLPTDANGQPVADARIRVRQNGQYEFVNQQGQPYPALLQLGVVDIADSTKMQKYGETYFSGGQVAAQSTGVIQQGKLEQSNVDLAQSMVSMISVSRMYEANQRMIRTLDTTLEKATSVGRLG